MSHWNYRVIKQNNLFAIHSVYYDDGEKIVGCSENPDSVVDEDFEHLKTQLTLMLEATEKEIIEFETIETIEMKSKSY